MTVAKRFLTRPCSWAFASAALFPGHERASALNAKIIWKYPSVSWNVIQVNKIIGQLHFPLKIMFFDIEREDTKDKRESSTSISNIWDNINRSESRSCKTFTRRRERSKCRAIVKDLLRGGESIRNIPQSRDTWLGLPAKKLHSKNYEIYFGCVDASPQKKREETLSVSMRHLKKKPWRNLDWGKPPG